MTTETMNVKTTVVSYEEYTDIDFKDPATFFFKDCFNNRIYIHTRSRQVAQQYSDDYTGVKNKYAVIASKDQKTKSSLESGGLSCTGTATRKR
ncbi:hypothetical protein D3C85_392630 [compost metagenome]